MEESLGACWLASTAEMVSLWFSEDSVSNNINNDSDVGGVMHPMCLAKKSEDKRTQGSVQDCSSNFFFHTMRNDNTLCVS